MWAQQHPRHVGAFPGTERRHANVMKEKCLTVPELMEQRQQIMPPLVSLLFKFGSDFLHFRGGIEISRQYPSNCAEYFLFLAALMLKIQTT